jgi:hypothetical protein
MLDMRRRDFITLLGGAAAAGPLAARAQQAAMPVIGILSGGSQHAGRFRLAAIQRGLNATGFVEGQNVAFEYRSAEGRYERLPQLAVELAGRRPAVIVAIGNTATVAAKAAITTIPIVFETSVDPVEHGLVASLARPGGNLTGVTILAANLIAKQFELLHEGVPKAAGLGWRTRPILTRGPFARRRKRRRTHSGRNWSSPKLSSKAISIRRSRRWNGSGSKPCSFARISFSTTGRSNSPRWRRVISCLRFIPCVTSPWRAA